MCVCVRELTKRIKPKGQEQKTNFCFCSYRVLGRTLKVVVMWVAGRMHEGTWPIRLGTSPSHS